MKSATLVGVLLATLFAAAATTTPVETRRHCPRGGGYCPVGTCTKFDPWAQVQYACIVANCGAANCQR